MDHAPAEAGAPTGAAGASAGVFSSPPRRARLNLARNPLSGRKPEGGSHVGAGVPRIPQRISATRRRTPLHRRAMKQHFLYKAVIRGGVVGSGSESTRASPVGFGFRVVASVASLARSLARSLAQSLARSLARSLSRSRRSPTKRPTNFIKATKTPHPPHPPKTAHSALRAAAARARHHSRVRSRHCRDLDYAS